jgi:hypothetical protein
VTGAPTGSLAVLGLVAGLFGVTLLLLGRRPQRD